MHPQNDDEEKIFRISVDFQTAWNIGDEKILADFFDRDCLRVGSFGETRKGRSEVEAAYLQLRKKELPDSKLLHERGFIIFLCPDSAIWQAPYEIFSQGAKTIKGYVLLILKKKTNNWLIVEMHTRIFPE